MFELGPSPVKLWAKQRVEITEGIDNFLQKYRSPDEEATLIKMQEEYAWLSSYSVLNLLYFIKGLVQSAIDGHKNECEVKTILGDSSKFMPELVGKFDLCYTSPPYFDFEDYGFHNKVIQECDNYDEYHKRVTIPVFTNVHSYLVEGGVLALQTEKSDALKSKWIAAILPIGFDLIADTVTGQEKIKYSQMSKRDQTLLIFRKK